jgi:hypothetical protein
VTKLYVHVHELHMKLYRVVSELVTVLLFHAGQWPARERKKPRQWIPMPVADVFWLYFFFETVTINEVGFIHVVAYGACTVGLTLSCYYPIRLRRIVHWNMIKCRIKMSSFDSRMLLYSPYRTRRLSCSCARKVTRISTMYIVRKGCVSHFFEFSF